MGVNVDPDFSNLAQHYSWNRYSIWEAQRA